jgi:hypothetical protein
MALGAPQGPTQSAWKISVASVLTVGEYPVPFEITAVPDNPDDPAVIAVIQKFVDFLNSSDDFRVTVATRTYAYTERMTPTV